MPDWKSWLKQITNKDSPTRKVAGIILIILGLLALVTPLTPGSWLIFVGLELLGIHLAVWDRLKSQLFRQRKDK